MTSYCKLKGILETRIWKGEKLTHTCSKVNFDNKDICQSEEPCQHKTDKPLEVLSSKKS